MGHNPGPQGNWFTTPEREALFPGRQYDPAYEDEISGEPQLAPGWWILPFALGGLIESYFAVQWIMVHL